MCRALQERGVNVSIATTNDGISNGTNKNGSHSYFERHKGVRTHIFPVTLNHSFKYSRGLASWLNSNVKQYDAVHIHAVFNHACVAAARACQKQGIPYVIRPLGTLVPWSMQQNPLRKKLFWQFVGRKMLDRASVVHYTAQGELSATEPSLNLSRGRVIPLGLEVDDACSERLPVPSIIGDATNNPYVLMLSRLHAKKGLDVLIDAFLNLTEKASYSHWRLLVAGDGDASYVNRLQVKVASRNAEEKVVFVGWLADCEKEAVLDHAALLALPSYQENFGLCVFEALAHEVPVLVSPQVNLSEDIKAASAGWVSEVDSSALEACLAQALGDKHERVRRGKAGKEFSRKFRWSKIAEDLEQLYSTITSRNLA
jgi:glycosyltransferase involved in cell wall biosynthesis